MSEMLLKVENLNFSYNKTPFLKNISFEIESGSFVSVLGQNGCGKSTLFMLLNGLLIPHSGSVRYKGVELSKTDLREKAREIAVIYQNMPCAFPFTCFSVVAMGLYPHRGYGDLSRAEIEWITEVMEMTDTLCFAEKRITDLSGGEMQRVLLARAMAQRPKLLFLDEAMSGFDIAVKLKMTALLKELTKKNGLSVVCVRHDLSLAFDTSDKIIALKNGEMLYFDTPKKLMTPEFFENVFGVKAEIRDNGFYLHN